MTSATVAIRRRRAALALSACALAGLVAGAAVGGRDEGPRFRSAVASTFATYGEPLACGGTLSQGRLGVAHRTLPCGTELTLRHRGETVRVPVIDRGPYVAGRDFDLTAATAAELRFDGLGTIEWAR